MSDETPQPPKLVIPRWLNALLFWASFASGLAHLWVYKHTGKPASYILAVMMFVCMWIYYHEPGNIRS